MMPWAAASRVIGNSARSALRRGAALEDTARSRTVLQEEERQSVTPPLHVPGELERVTEGVAGHSTRDEEIAIARRTELTHAPVIRWEIADCLILPGGIEARGAAQRIRRPGLRDLTTRPVRIDRALYARTGATGRYFGHWLQDGCAAALLAQPGEQVVLDHRPDWPNSTQYLDAFGLSPVPQSHLRVDRLAVLSDVGQGSLKRDRYARMRAQLEARFPGKDATGQRIFFRRGETGVARAIANEDAVLAALARHGFVVEDVAGASVGDLMRRFRGADCVITVDGSHMGHLYFALDPEACLLSLIPANRFTMVHVGYARAMNLRYGFGVMTPGPDGYHVDIDRLHALIEMAL